MTTATLGADWAAGRWLMGLSVSHSTGSGSYRQDGGEGKLDASLTGLYPYGGV